MSHQFIRNVEKGDTILGPSRNPFSKINLSFYWKLAQDLNPRTSEEIDQDNLEIGRQLMAGIWEQMKTVEEKDNG